MAGIHFNSVTMEAESDVSSVTEVMATLTTSNNTASQMDDVCFNTQFGEQVLLSYKIELWWSVVFVVIGLIANSLNILVFTSKNMRTVSSNVYLLNLALSDSMFLVTVTLAKIITAIRCLHFPTMRFDIYNINDFTCRLLQYMLDVFSDYSVMMILAFTVERYIACYYAIRFKELCTVRRAWIACISILLIISITILPYHVVCMEMPQGHQVCTVSEEKVKQNVFFYAYIIEMLVYRIIPVICIAVLNVFIIFKILKVHKQRKMRHSLSHHIKNGKSLCHNRSNSQSKASKEDRHVQLTVMLIIVSSTYIVLLLPNLVYFVVNRLVYLKTIELDYDSNLMFYNYSTMFFISAFAVNFFMYTLGGSVFRAELKSILLKNCLRKRICSSKINQNKNNNKRSSYKKYVNSNGTEETAETLI